MSGAASTPRVLVIGLGNRFRQDDAVGLLVAKRLREIDSSHVEVIEHEGDPLDLLPLWTRRDLAIVIDALNLPGNLGQIYQFDPDVDTPPNRETAVSSHGHSLWDAWELANLLDQRPQRAVILAVAGTPVRARGGAVAGSCRGYRWSGGAGDRTRLECYAMLTNDAVALCPSEYGLSQRIVHQKAINVPLSS